MPSNLIKSGFERAPHRALLKAVGVTDADMGKPFIAVVNSFAEIVPGHAHLQEFGKLVKAAVRAAGHARIRDETQGIVMLAVPVLAAAAGDDAGLLGALGCYAPLFRCPAKRQERVLAQLAAAATALARQLG